MTAAHRFSFIGILTLALCTTLLAGCIGGATVREDARINRYLDLVGGQVELLQPLQVPAGKARVFLQKGKLRSGFDFYTPHCSFEIRSIDHNGITIDPDSFEITRVTGEMTEIVQTGTLRVAALRLSGVDDGGISQYFEGYHFSLNSARQPEILRMNCFGLHAEPGDLRPPTLREIDATLGDIAHLHPPGE